MTMMHTLQIIGLSGVVILMTACGNESARQQETSESASVTVVAAQPDSLSLELPSIPATISAPEDMAGFIAIHFWDNLDFADTSKSLQMPFMEQNFVEYLSIMPAVMSADRVTAFQELIKRASVTPETRALIITLGERYLGDPDSPMKNQEYYADFRKAAGLED